MIAALFAIALLASLAAVPRPRTKTSSKVPTPGIRDRFMVTATLNDAPRRRPV